MKRKRWKFFSLLVLSFIVLKVNGQESVGINTDSPHSSAILDIESTTSGVLVPRMSSAQRTSISNPARGLLVYDNTTNTFWFYNNTVWTEIASSSSLDNIADGDNDTKIQVEESADEDVIRFDVEGREYFRMNNGRFEVVNTGNSIFMGQGAGVSDDLSDNNNVFIGRNSGASNSSGDNNIGLGYRSLQLNTTGTNNIGIGEDASRSNTTAGFNIAIGSNSLRSNQTASNNIAIGHNALQNHTSGEDNLALGYLSMQGKTSGSENVSIGNQAMQNNISGSQNVVIGRQAGQNSTGSGNVFIGYRAGRNETGSNKLYIESSDSPTPLIWGDFATDSLIINGSERVTGNISYIGTITDVSDKRLKENFESVENVLPLVNALEAYSYNMKEDTSKIREYGLIAQEVQKLFPELVKVIDEEKGHLGVSYVQLIPLLVQAIKEQQAFIEQQDIKISNSELRLKALHAEVEKISAKINSIK